MKFFLHTVTKVRVVSELGEFECTPGRFMELEPDYPGLTGGSSVRYWSEENAYFEGASAYDGHDCGGYCDRVLKYSALPLVFANVTLSKHDLCIDDPADSIVFTANLQTSEGVTIPLEYSWHIRLTHEHQGDVDRILLSFVQGVCSAVYRFNSHLPLGTWRIDESRFERVIFDREYQVKLVEPVEFVVYRTLEE